MRWPVEGVMPLTQNAWWCSSCALSCLWCRSRTLVLWCGRTFGGCEFSATHRSALNSPALALPPWVVFTVMLPLWEFTPHFKPALAQICDWCSRKCKELPSSHHPCPCTDLSPEILSVLEVPWCSSGFNNIPCYAVLAFTQVLSSVLQYLKAIMLYRNNKDHIS